jgi:aryl sulfotransferase
MDRMMVFLGIACDGETRRGILDLVTFAAMKRDAAKLVKRAEEMLNGGAATFINKGTNGRWRGVMTDDELAQYERAASMVMEPACKSWMEQGGDASR